MEFLHRAPRERLDWVVALSERLAPSDTCWKKRKGRGVRERKKGISNYPNTCMTQCSSTSSRRRTSLTFILVHRLSLQLDHELCSVNKMKKVSCFYTKIKPSLTLLHL